MSVDWLLKIAQDKTTYMLLRAIICLLCTEATTGLCGYDLTKNIGENDVLEKPQKPLTVVRIYIKKGLFLTLTLFNLY